MSHEWSPGLITHHSSLITGVKDAQGYRYRSRHHELRGRRDGGRRAHGDSQRRGQPAHPSVVAVNPKSGERMVGQVAKRQAITNPDNTIFSIKRFMGRKFDDPTVQRDRGLVPYKLSA